MDKIASFTVTNCPDREKLLAFSGGKLASAELESIGRHLTSCETCVAFLDSQTNSEVGPGVFNKLVSISEKDSEKASLSDTSFERLRRDSEFQRMKARAKRIEILEESTTATWNPPAESPRAPGEEVLPEKIGRYFVLRKLGRGGFANVYLARDPEQNRLVAIKVPRGDKFKNESQVEEFLREARTAATLDHPHIVPVFDFDRLPGGSCFVVMKYIEGRSLEAAMVCEKFSSEQSAQLCAQIADALDYAHQKKFVHRDIKPANILLDDKNQPYIADFGLAIHEESQQDRRGEYAGTLRYMSPEQAQGRAHHLDGRTDVWSLGVILYELLTRERPFASKNAQELKDEILNREPKPPRSVRRQVPEELERIVLRCLEKQVTDRCPSAAEVARKLRLWLPSTRRQPRIAATVVTSLLIVGAAILLLFGLPAILSPWMPGVGTDSSDENTKGGLPGPSATVQDPKMRFRLLESEPAIVFGYPGPDPIYDIAKQLYSAGPAQERWIARIHRRPSQPVGLQATVGLKDWTGTAGFAWQFHDLHERPGTSRRWLTAEIYRGDNQESCKLMVRRLQLSAGIVAQDILGKTEIALPKASTAKFNLVIEQQLLKLTFDNHPTLELAAPVDGTNSWLEDGELTIALTGVGTRATFKDIVLEIPTSP